MSAWPEVQIVDVAELIRGVTYAKDDARSAQEDGYLPVLRATNIQESRLVLESDLVFVPKGNVSANQTLRAGDIVVATSSGSKHLVGKSALLGHEWGGSFGAFCAAIRPKRTIEPRYLASFLQSPAYWKQIGEKSMGVNINNLRRGDIESVTLPLPDLEEQRRIVAEIEKQFSRLDEAVANLQRVKANLKRYKAAILKTAVEGRLVETEASLAHREGRSYETGACLLKLILSAQGELKQGRGRKASSARATAGAPTTLPDGWAWATLGQLLSERIVNGLSIKESTEPTDVRALRLSAMRGESIDFSDYRYLPISSNKVHDILIQACDVFISRGNGSLDLVGRACAAGTPPFPTIFPDTMMRLRFTQAAPVSAWTGAVWHSRLIREQIESRVKTTAGIYKIAQPELASVLIPLPPLAEQKRITTEIDRRLSVLRNVEAEVDANLQRAKSLRQASLVKAFMQGG